MRHFTNLALVSILIFYIGTAHSQDQNDPVIKKGQELFKEYTPAPPPQQISEKSPKEAWVEVYQQQISEAAAATRYADSVIAASSEYDAVSVSQETPPPLWVKTMPSNAVSSTSW